MLKNSFVAVASVILTLAAVEIALRLLSPVPFFIENNLYFVADDLTGYRIQPHSVGSYDNGVPAMGNAHGHRDEFVSIQRSPGVSRVLVLGDSFTQGAGVEMDKVYAQVLESLLSAGNQSVEVVNTGVGGWEPFQYAQYFENWGLAFAPDLVIVGFFIGNDSITSTENATALNTAVLGQRVSKAAALQHHVTAKVFAYNHFHLARLIFHGGVGAARRGRSPERRNCQDFSPRFLEVQNQRARTHLAESVQSETAFDNSLNQISRIVDLASENGIETLIVLIPDETQINQVLQQTIEKAQPRLEFDWDMPNVELRQRLAGSPATVVDLLDDFRRDSRCLYNDTTHWTSEGHYLAATRIADEIRERNLLPTE